MLCPKCGQEAGEAAACPRCGVVFAKLRAKPPDPIAPTASPAATPPRPRPVSRPARPRVSPYQRPLLLAAATAVAVGGAFWMTMDSSSGITGSLGRAERPELGDISIPLPPDTTLPMAPPNLQPAPPPELEVGGRSLGMSEEERRRADTLLAIVRGRGALGPTEVQSVLELVERHPGEMGLLPLAEGVLVSAAQQRRRERRYEEAAELLRRAIALVPVSKAARSHLLGLLLEASDWTAAEAAARDLLAMSPGDASALRGLGFALLRQDRNREAAEALRASLEIQEDATARRMLAHVEKGMRDETGMSEKQLAHFHVRYDGAEHEDVGREILRALERHFANLTTVFDHRPTAPIPVILFSEDAYYDAAGAPRWSGGAYNHLDGRIRVPIGGLSSSLTPDIDNVLVHEVAHAFIHDMSRGICPRDVHEGLAQYMEGKRIALVLKPDELKALADGRVRGVSGFYLGALAFVEHLFGQRGQGGVNDLLKAMGETGDANAAFRRVYGQDHGAASRAFSDRFRIQYGS